MVGHGGSSAGLYLADPTSPIPSHCASIVVTSTLRVNMFTISHEGRTTKNYPFTVLNLIPALQCSCGNIPPDLHRTRCDSPSDNYVFPVSFSHLQGWLMAHPLLNCYHSTICSKETENQISKFHVPSWLIGAKRNECIWTYDNLDSNTVHRHMVSVRTLTIGNFQSLQHCANLPA